MVIGEAIDARKPAGIIGIDRDVEIKELHSFYPLIISNCQQPGCVCRIQVHRACRIQHGRCDGCVVCTGTGRRCPGTAVRNIDRNTLSKLLSTCPVRLNLQNGRHFMGRAGFANSTGREEESDRRRLVVGDVHCC